MVQHSTIPVNGSQWDRDRLFAMAIVKGQLENGDPCRHFGSLMGFQHHLDETIKLGWVFRDDAGQLSVTDAGRTAYHDLHLDKLPDGRAAHWEKPK